MSFFHAVIEIDHHTARVMHFDANEVEIDTVAEHKQFTRQHNSGVRTEHEFFAEVCNALADVTEVLVTGSHLAQADFRRYVDKHRPEMSKHIVGWETVDHPKDGQLLAFARQYFIRHPTSVIK